MDEQYVWYNNNTSYMQWLNSLTLPITSINVKDISRRSENLKGNEGPIHIIVSLLIKI